VKTLTIKSFSDGYLEEILPFLSHATNAPYEYLPVHIRGVSLTRLWLHELRQTLENDGDVLAAALNREIVGIIAFAPLDWDTRVLQVPTTRISHLSTIRAHLQSDVILDRLLRQALEQISSSGCSLVVARSSAQEAPVAHALEEAGFRWQDTLLDYVYDGTTASLDNLELPDLEGEACIRSAEERDVNSLVALAESAFGAHFGRFHADPRIGQQKAVTVYQEWMRAAMAGYADAVLVAEVENRLAGCSIWKLPSRTESACGVHLGHYSIGAVDPAFSKRGLFTALTFAGMKVLEKSVGLIEGPTHVSNHAVQRAYARLRWSIRGARHSFHRWLM